jgi:hypothetical protein
MRLDDIRQLTRAQPFVPFRVHIASGESYDITHPDMLVSTLGSICVAAPDQDHPLSDGTGSFRIHSLYHVHTIELLMPPPPRAGTNGVHPNSSNES